MLRDIDGGEGATVERDAEVGEPVSDTRGAASPVNGNRTDEGRSTKSPPGASSSISTRSPASACRPEDGFDGSDTAAGDEDAQRGR